MTREWEIWKLDVCEGVPRNGAQKGVGRLLHLNHANNANIIEGASMENQDIIL